MKTDSKKGRRVTATRTCLFSVLSTFYLLLSTLLPSLPQDVDLDLAATEITGLAIRGNPDIDDVALDQAACVLNGVDARILAGLEVHDRTERQNPRIGRNHSTTNIGPAPGSSLQRISRRREALSLAEHSEIRLLERLVVQMPDLDYPVNLRNHGPDLRRRDRSAHTALRPDVSAAPRIAGRLLHRIGIFVYG